MYYFYLIPIPVFEFGPPSWNLKETLSRRWAKFEEHPQN